MRIHMHIHSLGCMFVVETGLGCMFVVEANLGCVFVAGTVWVGQLSNVIPENMCN